jgi:hypothetical protein
MKANIFRFLVMSGMLSASVCARAAEPWDVPFAGGPREIMEAAKRIAVPADQVAIVLLEEHQYTIDENGRTISKLRKVAAGALGSWKELQGEAERKLKKDSKDREALRAMATSKIQSGDRDGAARYLKSLTDSPYAGPDVAQLEAWNTLLSGRTDSELLAKFDRWSGVPELTSADYWYTRRDAASCFGCSR